MKTIVTALLCCMAFVAAANVETDSTEQKKIPVELVRVWPEPFADFLQFDFAVHDTAQHIVKIMIINERHETVFMEKVQVFQGHEQIKVNTIDFFLPGIYSIKVKCDQKYRFLKKLKRAD